MISDFIVSILINDSIYAGIFDCVLGTALFLVSIRMLRHGKKDGLKWIVFWLLGISFLSIGFAGIVAQLLGENFISPNGGLIFLITLFLIMVLGGKIADNYYLARK